VLTQSFFTTNANSTAMLTKLSVIAVVHKRFLGLKSMDRDGNCPDTGFWVGWGAKEGSVSSLGI
jgi:hypothetical protein